MQEMPKKHLPMLRVRPPKRQLRRTMALRTTLSERFECHGCFLVTYTVSALTNLNLSLSLSNLSIIRLTDVLLFATVCTVTSDLTFISP